MSRKPLLLDSSKLLSQGMLTVVVSRNRNTISRFANKMPWAPDDILEPLFNLDTGAEIRGVHFRADLDRMSCTCIQFSL